MRRQIAQLSAGERIASAHGGFERLPGSRRLTLDVAVSFDQGRRLGMLLEFVGNGLERLACLCCRQHRRRIVG